MKNRIGNLLKAFVLCAGVSFILACNGYTNSVAANFYENSSEAIIENTSEEMSLSEIDETKEIASEESEEQPAEDSTFWIKYIDVGQGDSALVQCDGRYMLIDGGDNKQSSKIYTILKQDGIERLDFMIATHPDADHIGGLSGALNYATVDRCFCPVTSHDTKTFNSLVKYLNKQNKEIEVPKPGDEYVLGSAHITILGPLVKGSESNNDSIVLMIQYGNNRFLFTGDAEEEEENTILSAWPDIKCDVLKVAHHGSKSSTSDYFLAGCRPEYAIISVGQGNEYGHPTQDVLNKLSALGTKTYRTDLQGDIIVTSDGTDIQITCKRCNP